MLKTNQMRLRVGGSRGLRHESGEDWPELWVPEEWLWWGMDLEEEWLGTKK